ncbi:hypothetical protein RHSIM_Rhsim10G0173100 [Rhododendron simsii]|uniref:NAB domain-containing protein n=1 Tax=Rhododendron simsii TaxID=118357 RepID=A0A834GA14_RHOSS|nr:hypothetical protein RHSIM_Rhsim10G0173100 [Rhododendron simsii]
MEEKVQNVLKLIEEDGDTFAKRAEMYYERRPGIINFVEESYRAYRALAERYDHMSTDLQSANTTLATVCPERVQLAMDIEEEDGSKFPSRKKLQAKPKAENSDKTVCKSGLSKSEAVQEIDKLQKEIMALQTVKEFVKSSYESGLQKYWEIEARVIELQERVLGLEEEFDMGKGNEDGEARALMAEEVLKLCEETLAQLEEKQERSTEEAKEEYKRVEDAREKLNSLKNKFLSDKPNGGGEKPLELKNESGYLEQEKRVSDKLREKIAGHFDVGSKESLNVTDLTEKIDELVSKVINLETSVSSQPALIDRLRTETDELQAQIRILEDEKATLVDGNDSLTTKLREMEEKCENLEDLNLNLENQNNHLQAHFTEARCSIDHLSEYMESSLEEESNVGIGSPEELEKREDFIISMGSKAPAGEDKIEQFCNSDAFSEKREDPNSLEKVEKQGTFQTEEIVVVVNNEPWEVEKKKEDEMNWREMLLDGVEDKETILLTEYITILRNYKDLRKKLSDVERKNRDRIFETMVQLRELRSLIGKRDKEIQFLRQKLRENKDLNADDGVFEVPQVNEEDEHVKLILVGEPRIISPLEEKLRMNIDALLDENLDFWLRFSTSFHQIQKFKSGFLELESEIEKIKEKKEKRNQGGIGKTAMQLELKTIYMHLVEIKTEARLWIEKSGVLKDELQRRFASLCEIEEEIAKALNAGAEEEEMRFTSHEAAMFQGEVSNMKLENNKVRDELEVGLDCVNKLRQEIEKTIGKLNVEYGLFGSKSCDESQFGRVRVPLRSFIFGAKLKKKKSIFSFMHRRKRSLDLRPGMPM